MKQDAIRDVRLTGQAFFEVVKKVDSPFVLELGDVGLKVTGTSFNASSYKDDPSIEVVLETGKVALFEGTYANAEKFTLLEPGEIAVYRKGSRGFTVERTDVRRHTSWTTGELIFRDTHLADVFKQMERWYNVKILVEDPEINTYLFTATIKKESLESILRLIEYTSNLECKLIKSKTYKPVIMVKTKEQ
jgi:ferric-dicitrate binding protein FerR (iron transport regulator)